MRCDFPWPDSARATMVNDRILSRLWRVDPNATLLSCAETDTGIDAASSMGHRVCHTIRTPAATAQGRNRYRRANPKVLRGLKNSCRSLLARQRDANDERRGLQSNDDTNEIPSVSWRV